MCPLINTEGLIKEPQEEEDEEEEPQEDEDEEKFTSLPSGIVDQNNNVSIVVEILSPIANPREELNKLVGCDDIKKRMDELVALTTYNKTTVCKI